MQVDLGMQPLHLSTGGQKTCVPIYGPATKAQPDCDDVSGLMFPLPAVGGIEGSADYTCGPSPGKGGDCHLLVYDEANSLLWEAYQAYYTKGKGLFSSCVVVWDLEKHYPSNLRGDQCTSVDAAGFPVAPLATTVDEVYAGHVSHAQRFTLPNNLLQHGVYAHPATHAGVPIHPTGPPGGPDPSPFYGMRMRLRSNVTAAVLRKRTGAEKGSNATATDVVLRGMQTYGIIMADGGSIPLTMAGDRFSKHKWSEIGIDTHFLFGLTVDDFEVLQPLDPTVGPKHDGRVKLTFVRPTAPMRFGCLVFCYSSRPIRMHWIEACKATWLNVFPDR